MILDLLLIFIHTCILAMLNESIPELFLLLVVSDVPDKLDLRLGIMVDQAQCKRHCKQDQEDSELHMIRSYI